MNNLKQGEHMNNSSVSDNIKEEAATIIIAQPSDKLLSLSAPGFFVIKKAQYTTGADLSIIDNLTVADEEYYIIQDIG